MAFVHGICPNCGHEIDLPEEVDAAYCPECGVPIIVDDLIAHNELREMAEDQSEQPEQPPRGSEKPGNPQPALSPFSGNSPFQQERDTPFLAQWKTDGFFTVLGILMQLMLAWTLTNLAGGQDMARNALETGQLAYTPAFIIAVGAFGLVRALIAFAAIPKRFRASYEGRNYLVSFVNGLVGGIIFGPYWNSRLTKRRLGISHLVFFVLLATDGLSSIMMLLFTV